MKAVWWILAVGAMLSGCKGGFSSRTSSSPGVLREALTQSVVTFDPGRVQDPEIIALLGNIYDPLVGYSEKNEIEPRLAESYEAKEGGKVWVFHLRKDAKFHNGGPVRAEDFKWTLERNLAKSFASPVALNYLSGIVGAKELNEGSATSLSGVKVLDDHTLQITLTDPRYYFLGQLTYPCGFVLSKEAVGSGQIVDKKQMVGTGPFMVDKIVPDQEVDLIANPGYYMGAPKIERIQRPLIKDSLTRLNKYRQGELDIYVVDRTQLAAVKADPKLSKELVTRPQPTVLYVGLNSHLYKPFANRDVRRAFAMAIDRDHIAGDLLGGMPVAHGLIAQGVPGYRDDYAGLAYDPAQARTLLAAAGYPNGKGLPSLELNYMENGPDNRLVAQGVQESLKSNLNWPMTLRSLEPSVFFDSRNAGRLSCWYLSWGADYPDPQNFTTFLLRSDSSMDFESYKNEEFDRIGRAADASIDPIERLRLYDKAEDILIQDVARVPLYYQVDNVLVSPRISGLRVNLMGDMPHIKIEVK
jgi:oligopeptide transport system substrate-binding protein